MPLINSCSIDAFKKNIAELIQAGHKPSEAVAIAHSVLEEACKRENKPKPDTRGK